MFSAELFRKLEGIVEIGLIKEIDHANKQLRVLYESDEEDELTAWLPWPTEVGRNFTRWRPLQENTQVILLSESGDLANAVIVGMLYTDAQDISAPSTNPDLDIIQFNDGTSLQYDIEDHTLSVSAIDQLNLSAKTLNISAETLNMIANNTNWLGHVLHSIGDFISNDVSLPNHDHAENDAGNNTDKPNTI